MLSILIPTYNYNVYLLAKELVQQALQENIKFELICIDDGSNAKINIENQKINTLTNSVFIANKENIGLSSMRQLLANKATNNWLLFIDADMQTLNNNYIKNYIYYCKKKEAPVIYGGITYAELNNSNKNLLRIVYGKKAECKTVNIRNKSPFLSILCSNILLHKEVFKSIQFELKLKQYGYEDALFAYQLKSHNFTVKHIDNQLLHNDATPNAVYINKTEQALQNLCFLTNNKLIDYSFVKLSSFYNSVKPIGLHYIFSFIYFILGENIKHKISKKTPSVFLFNLYKLSYYSYLKLNSNKKNAS
ncbi:MAG: glycosyltransferase family 2 protein [Oceanihabitans sp.]